MKRKELKKAFEEMVKDIKVSDSLKEKTINNIYSKNNVYHFPYWIKNCAAIFIVTCLCLSIYVINNKNIFYKKNIPENIIIEDSNTENSESIYLDDANLYNDYKLKSLPTKNYVTTNEILNSQNAIAESTLLEKSYGIIFDSIEERSTINYIGLSEIEFLANNPNARKTENGYIIMESGKEILYTLKDGIISEKIIE